MTSTITALTDIASIRDYLSRIGAEPRSLKTAVVKEYAGIYWIDKAVIRFRRNGKVDAPPDYMPTAEEAMKIEVELATVVWPEILKLSTPTDQIPFPDELKKNWENVYIFRDLSDDFIMAQQRVEDKSGGKYYLPWTFWNDNVWRLAEPEGELPLWGLERIKGRTTLFIHEGAKTAYIIDRMIREGTILNHPWGVELATGAHVGWIGGALNTHRTNWKVLNGINIKTVVIVSDNDLHGKHAVPAIAQHLHIPTYHVQFTEEWPVSFDLADDFPEEMFHDCGGKRFYTGPSIRSVMEPATWATDMVPIAGTNKSFPVLRESFVEQWSFIPTLEMFICRDMPNYRYKEKTFNNLMRAFSHSPKTSDLIYQYFKGKTETLTYQPGKGARVVVGRNPEVIGINCYIPPDIRPEEGDETPFLEFMDYLITVEKERKEVLRWVATLLAKLDRKMGYGLMMTTETQGIGKTLFASEILSPIVGPSNVAHPTEAQITSDFNGWGGEKRLIIAEEIYQGHGWTAYNKLKSIITDRIIDVNRKHMSPYTIENFAHVIGLSNARKALKIDDTDRRWLYPTLNETLWGMRNYGRFRNWLKLENGYSTILHWAIEKWDDYVEEGERAPMTERKREAIDLSRSEAQQLVIAICEAVRLQGLMVVLFHSPLMEWAQNKFPGKFYDTVLDLRKAAATEGWETWSGGRIMTGGLMQYAIMSPAMSEAVKTMEKEGKTKEEIREFIKSKARHVSSLQQDSF